MKKWYKAGYTVEASLIMPIILLTISQGMKMGMDLYVEVKEASAYAVDLQELKAAEVFYRAEGLERLWGDLYGDGV